MEWIAAGFVAGAWASIALPPAAGAALLAAWALAAWLRRGLRGAGLAFLVGTLLTTLAIHTRQQADLAPALAGIDLTLSGRVAGLPERDTRRVRFEFVPARAWRDGQEVVPPARVRLAWYGPQPPGLLPGEQWQLTVRLRSPRGFSNPGGFDYAGWLFRHGIGATGYVRAQPPPVRIAAADASVDLLRARLRGRLWPRLVELEHGPVLLALTLGDRAAIGPQRWHTLIATGTNHLMAISGLHIGLVAALGYGLGALAWRVLGPLRLRLARPLVQAGVALALAGLYAAMAGFALPTVRALTMLTLALGAVCLRRRARPWPILAGAALLVLLLDPLAVLAPGFWLSFGAVAAIVLIAAGRLRRPRRIAAWLRLQGAIALALTPLLLALFREASLVMPLANLIAVPWVSAVTVPSALAGALLFPLSPAVGGGLLLVADASMALLWPLLEWLAQLPYAQWRGPAYPSALLLLSGLAALVLLLPRGVPGKPAALLALVPLLLWQPPRPDPGAFWVDVLDVGQGLALVVRTAGHTLVYDAGPRYSATFDAGSAVVVPFLRAAGTGRIDALVISHGDDDHAGGARSVRAQLRPQRVWSSVPRRVGGEAGFCARGTGWHWDGVRFRFLHPARDGVWVGNNGSCVLRVEARGGSLLLPGDIEAAAERHLVEYGAELDADIVIAPHHGSSTSSTAEFVRAVAPQWVVYSVGESNQWRFPRPEIMRRWRPAGWARTDCAGALHFEVDPIQGVAPPRPWREQRRPWQSACAGAGKSVNMRAVRPPGGKSLSVDTTGAGAG